MAKKHVAPVYPVAPLQERESRWQCATCRGYLAFSLPIDATVMARLLLEFSKGHERCAPLQTGTARPRRSWSASEDAPAGAAEAAVTKPVATPMSYDPSGPTAKAMDRRNVLLALPREHTPTEKAELGRLEKKLIMAGVLTLSTTF